MFTHKIGSSYKTDAGTVAGATETVTGNTDLAYDFAIPTGSAGASFNVEIIAADILSCAFYADEKVIIKTNNATGDNTITLATAVPLIWSPQSTTSCPITTDAELLLCTTSGPSAANLKVRVLQNL